MSTSVYAINKGINQPIEFRGLKAQFIWWLGGGLLVLLILFAILYICGINTFICLALILAAGTGWFVYIYHLSRTYGEHGMMKKIAKRSLPRLIRTKSRKLYQELLKKSK